jgi:hypothetical protein
MRSCIDTGNISTVFAILSAPLRFELGLFSASAAP